MRQFIALIFTSIFSLQLNAFGNINSKVSEDALVIKEIQISANGSGVLEISSNSDLWIGFNFDFPEGEINNYKGTYIFEIKDLNGFAGITTGPVDNSASTVFSMKSGKISVSYKNNTNLTYKVIFWSKNVK